jgi:hypothetical protein
MRSRNVVAAGAAVLILAAAGCGGGSPSADNAKAPNPNAAESSPPGDIPDNQAFVRYRPPGAGFSVEVPEGWSRIGSGGAVTFTDKLNSIRIEPGQAKRAATAAQIAKGIPGAKADTVSRKAGGAVRVTYLTKGKADPVTGKSRTLAVERYVFFHNGREATLTLSGAKGADNVDPWRIVTDSLRWSG